jgi:hypothetical protein
MENEKGAIKAETPTIGEIANVKMTLKIWDVPPELGKRFIARARSYGNRSWLCLQDIMAKADKFDELVSSGKILEIDKRLSALEKFKEELEAAAREVSEEEKEEPKPKVPKTFGGAGTDGKTG